MSEQYRQSSASRSVAAANGSLSGAPGDRAQACDALRAFFAGYDELFVLTGPAGSGKTAMTAQMLGELDASVPLVLLDAASLTENGLMNAVCRQLGLETWSTDWEVTLDLLANRLKASAHAFLVIDNAHDLGESAFEDLRLLSYLRCGHGPQLQAVLLGHQALLAQVQSNDMARLGLWHVQSFSLKAPPETAKSVSPGDGSAADVISNVKPLTPPTRLPLRPQGVARYEGEARGELATLVPIAAREHLLTATNSDEVSGNRLPVRGSVYDGELAVLQSLPVWRRPSFLALLLSPLLLAGVYWLGYSQAREPGDDTPLTAGPTESAGPAVSATGQGASASPDALRTPSSSVVAQSSPLVVMPMNLLPSPPAAAVPLALYVPGTATADAATMTSVAGEPAAAGESDEVTPARFGKASADQPQGLVDEIGELLAAAQAAMARDHLRTPAETSAWGYYDQVLALQPENADALRGMGDIVDRYEVLTRLAIERGRYRTAQIYINRGLAVAAGHEGLIKQQDALDSALAAAKLAQVREEQARLAAAEAEAEAEAASAPQEEAVQEAGGLLGVLKNIFAPQNQ